MKSKIEISPYGSLLVYKKDYDLDFVRSIIEEKELKGLRIFAHLKDDRLNNLDFLGQYTFLEVLDISSVDDYDFGFLSSLKELKELTINTDGKNIINLANQVNLESLTIHWRISRILGLEKCQSINSLCIIDFREENFSSISRLRKLRNLKVKTASIKSLEGIQDLKMLETLLLGNCKRLETLNAIGPLIHLISLNIELCPKIEDYNPIGILFNLKSLRITDCKSVNTIKYINKLSSLESLMLLGNTDVLDSDLTPAKNINNITYKHRNHYNIRLENKINNQAVNQNIEKIKRQFNT
jgi:hypothetical protein